MDSKQKAEELVNGKRQADYGHPKVNMKRIARIWSGILDIDVTPEQVALCMVGLKLARLVHSPEHEDTQVDMMGYLKVLQRLLDPEDQPASSSGVAEVKVNWHKPDPFSDWTEEEKKCGWKVMGNPTEPWKPGKGEFYSDPAGTTIYADGSKDMTFEEACGPRRNPCGQ